MNDILTNERAQHLLKLLVERYIRDGQPVGSRVLAEEAAIPFSPATIRNVLAELEEQGFLSSPHTSAGRVPTTQGYRLFVDTLLTVKPVDQIQIEQFQQLLNPDLTIPDLLSSTSTLLSEISKLVGLVTLPRRERLTIRHVEFLPLSGNRILVILVFSDREVQNRIIHTDRKYSANELQQAANYLNTQYAGMELAIVRKHLLEAMRADQEHMDKLMRATLDIAEKAFENSIEQEDYVLAGQTHLLNWGDITNISHLRQLFEAFSEKHAILHLLDQCLNAEGIQIFIGEESGYGIFGEYSIVTAPYSVEDQVVGVLAVLGPTRMPYDRVIPLVDVTAKLLSAALNSVK